MGNQESKIQVREVELPAIEIRDLVKVYKLYDRARDRVKDAFGLSRHKAQKRHYALNGVNSRNTWWRRSPRRTSSSHRWRCGIRSRYIPAGS